MLQIHPSAAALLAAGLAVSITKAVVAQVATVEMTTQDTELFGARNTDAGLGVNSEAIVVTPNQKIAIFDKAGFLHESSLNANLNFDGGVDLLDMALFNDFYATGARRVDMNIDGQTDATDAAIYADEYDKATSP